MLRGKPKRANKRAIGYGDYIQMDIDEHSISDFNIFR